MPRNDLDRLRYWKTRRQWSARMPLGAGRYERKTFGDAGVAEDDKAAHAQAVLEFSQWLDRRNEKLDVAAHVEAMKQAESDYDRSRPILKETRRRFKAGEMSKDEAEGELARAISLDMEGWQEMKRLKQPQLRLLKQIEELRPLADRALELDAENKQLAEENEHLKALLAASGRAAATEVGDLDKLAEEFKVSHWNKLRAKGTNNKTMQAIRSATDGIVEWLADYSPAIKTSADLDAMPRALADFRDSVLERIEDKSSGWARKTLNGPRLFCEWMVGRGYLAALPRSIGRDWNAVGKDDPHPTYFSDDEIRALLDNCPDDELRIALLLGVNCAYRESDLVTLRASEVDLKQGIIKRTRSKTGALQVHRLWGSTAELLSLWMQESHDGRPLAFLKGVSLRLTAFIDETLEGNGELEDERRTAKSCRCTAAQLVEQETDGEQPHLVSQMLGHTDTSMAKHYRKANFSGLFAVIDRIEKRLGV